MFTKPRQFDDYAYSKQFFTVTRQGHVRTTQAVGGPALTWHCAFWPKKDCDPNDTQAIGSSAAATDNMKQNYNERRKEVVRDLNGLLIKLQERGRAGSRVMTESFGEPAAPNDYEGSLETEHPLSVYAKESVSFTLWWSDDDNDPISSRPNRRPKASDVRVRVQADITSDFSSLAFFIDPGKAWNTAPIYRSQDAVGERRRKMFEVAESVRAICEARSRDQEIIDADVYPEPDGEAFRPQALELKDAADYLYDAAWMAFCKDFDVDVIDIAGNTDKVFASFKGVVLSTNGLEELGSIAGIPCPQTEAVLRPALRFRGESSSLPKADKLPVDEPGAVIKAFWPFVRRFRAEADYRDWIACGIFDWRALYITAVGAQSEFDPFDESDGWKTDVAAGEDTLPKRRLRHQARANGPEPDWTVEPWKSAPTTGEPHFDRPAPFRYLILTKGEPNRRQLGRMIDRVNMLGTLRLFALRNWSLIRDADYNIRMYGQQLDGVIQRWTKATNKRLDAYHSDLRNLEAEHEEKITEFERNNKGWWSRKRSKLISEILDTSRALQDRSEGLRHRRLLESIRDEVGARTTEASLTEKQKLDNAASLEELRALAIRLHTEARKLKSHKDEELAVINQEAEHELIAISTALDKLGNDAIGGLPFRLNRATYFANLYRSLLPTLRCGAVETWWSYEQFALRGVEPSLKYIESVSERLEKLRRRLNNATDSVQTSAIVNQTEATRDNTFQLEIIVTQLREIVVKAGNIEASINHLKKWAARIGALTAIIGLVGAITSLIFGIVRQ